MGDRSDHRRATEIFGEVVGLPAEARPEALERLCAGDARLRSEVESLLAAHSAAGGFLGRSSGTKTLSFQGSLPLEERAARLPEIEGFEILSELGSGGMGSVYEAIERKLNRAVALKVMHLPMGDGLSAAKRFEFEAWVTGQLNHPNVVAVHGYDLSDDWIYYWMEKMPGGSLADVVERLRQHGRDDRFGLEFGSAGHVRWVLEAIVAVSRGLAAAHGLGLIHRDVKPRNLLLSIDPFAVKVADFGLAVDPTRPQLTRDGRVPGTPLFMAPEQIRGERERVGPATDVYALGVTLFQLLTLELPFEGETLEAYHDAVKTRPPRRAGAINALIDRDLDTVIETALHKDPADRYASVASFAADLENILADRPIAAQPWPLHKRLRKWARRHPARAGLAAVAAVALLAVSTLSFTIWSDRAAVRTERIAALSFEIQESRHAGDYAAVIEDATRLLALAPDSTARLERLLAHLRLAAAARRSGDATEAALHDAGALRDVESLVAQHPERAWPLHWKARVLRSQQRLEEAAATSERADAMLRGKEPSAIELARDAEIALYDERYDRAVESSSAALVLDPDSTFARETRAQAFEGLGLNERAIEDYRELVSREPELFSHRYNLGAALADLGGLIDDDALLDEAQDYLEQASRLAPNNAHPYEALSGLFVQRAKRALDERPAEAMRLLVQAQVNAELALRFNDDLPWSHVNRGVALMEQYRHASPSDPALAREAMQAYATAESILQGWPAVLSQDHVLVMAQLNQCDGWIELADAPRAIEACLKVASQIPDDPNAHYNLAGAYALAGDPDRAFDSLRRDVELGDTDWGYLEGDSWFESLRDDPRFAEIVGAMKVAAAR